MIALDVELAPTNLIYYWIKVPWVCKNCKMKFGAAGVVPDLDLNATNKWIPILSNIEKII